MPIWGRGTAISRARVLDLFLLVAASQSKSSKLLSSFCTERKKKEKNDSRDKN
uniref:Uncharacterized protein n=1 Tax=Arundo donax TaxID=35708 RepID=A0A0A9B4B6_ARUDO